MPLFMQTIGYVMSSSICKAKLLYCTGTDTHDTAKFTADTDTGIGISSSLLSIHHGQHQLKKRVGLYAVTY